jgi:hypothetical protein
MAPYIGQHVVMDILVRHYQSNGNRCCSPNHDRRRHKMKPGIGAEERPAEDEIARRRLGPRGVPGGQDFAKMTPQEEKNIPKKGVCDGHTA